MEENKTGKVMVLGASQNPSRYSNLAIRMLQEYDHDVLAVGRREGEVNGVAINTQWPNHQDIHTLTLYLNAQNQVPHYQEILNLKPKRVIFNPGTENHELQDKLNEAGIEFLEACTLVMLRTNQF